MHNLTECRKVLLFVSVPEIILLFDKFFHKESFVVLKVIWFELTDDGGEFRVFLLISRDQPWILFGGVGPSHL